MTKANKGENISSLFCDYSKKRNQAIFLEENSLDISPSELYEFLIILLPKFIKRMYCIITTITSISKQNGSVDQLNMIIFFTLWKIWDRRPLKLQIDLMSRHGKMQKF